MKALLWAFTLLFAANGFGQVKKPVQSQKLRKGVASYYHNKFHGRKTANGERYSKDAFTAASNVFPLNKWVKVTNQKNGESVIVKITDRMARNNKRLIDVSMASARKLQMVGHGLVRVTVELLTNYKPAENAQP